MDDSPASASASASSSTRRLAALRRLMGEQGLDYLLVPSADEHQNEYVPAHRQRRAAVTGFTGSAGDAAIGIEDAHLFVDSRYHLQAEQEVEPSVFHVHKVGAADEIELVEWLRRLAKDERTLRIGFDPFVTALSAHERLATAVNGTSTKLVPLEQNPVDQVWSDRPVPPRGAVYALPADVTGEPAAEKLARVRAAMGEQRVTALVLTRLDEVAWLTNLRGSDIPYNPVFEAYLIVEPALATCFTDNPLPAAVRQALAGAVAFAPYAEFGARLEALAREARRQGGRLWLDSQGTSYGTRLLADPADVRDAAPNPVVRLKATKNAVEIACSREGHVRAGLAKVRSFARLAALLAEGARITEAGYAALLEAEYAREEGYADLSFATIAAYGANGAIVHYGTPSAEVALAAGGLLLVDSGIQIRGATTDDTRTIALGEPSAPQRARYTDVLRGHIRLAMQVFPEGTTGQHLDALARSALWNEGLDFGHGTGHGVGAFLNVHEGPHGITPRSAVPLEPGMIVSNEPGYYLPGWGGIRLENLYVVEEAAGLPPHPAGRRWLRFSALTMIPFDRRLIDWPRLSREEAAWLVGYHGQVRERLLPHLEGRYGAWLADACAALP
ncbi:MAG: aminopeptidase P family protein [Candidatus Lambdaproteobacteria bacterium]|nr:aminopeptidase P family protein [Candidatus Lambdaproteobacteria bacterium]